MKWTSEERTKIGEDLEISLHDADPQFDWAAGMPVLKGAIRVGAHAHYRPGRGGQTVLCGAD